MKALLLTNEYPPNVYGGAGVHVDYLSRRLAELIDVDVRCFGEQDLQEASLLVKGHGYDPRLFEQTPGKLRSPFQAIQQCLSFAAEPTDANVVHCHTWYSHMGGIFVKKAYDIPLVVTTHSLEPSRPWKREQLGTGYDLSCWIEKTAMEMADKIIAVSAGMKEDVLQYFDVDPDRIDVIYNGIDAQEYRPVETRDSFEKYGIDPTLPFVLFVGRITRQKGIIHLVNSIPFLDDGIQVVLCAGAPDTPEIAAEMKAGVEKVRQTCDHVVWIEEMVDKPTVLELYSHAAAFCCPSIYEPFGIINLEAMACNTPVVASAVGGIKEVVLPEETGLLVPLDQHTESPFEPRDPETFSRDLASAVNQLMADPERARQMGQAGRKRVEERFSWTAIARQTVDLYESAL